MTRRGEMNLKLSKLSARGVGRMMVRLISLNVEMNCGAASMIAKEHCGRIR